MPRRSPRGPKALRAAVLAVVVGLWSATTMCTGRPLLLAREQSYPRTLVQDCPQADAIVVPSGDGPPRLRRLYSLESPSRSETALTLYAAEKAPWLVFTDGGPEGEQSRAAAVHEGIPAERIIVLRPAHDTADEARLFVSLAKERAWHHLILVTSGYHMARAKLLTESAAKKEKISLSVFGYVGDSGKFFYRNRSRIRELFPSFGGWERTTRAVREVLGEWVCRAGIC